MTDYYKCKSCTTLKLLENFAIKSGDQRFKTCESCRARNKRAFQEKKHKCTFIDCKRTFGNHGHLMQHIKVDHDGIRDYVCGECGQKFAASNHLTAHEKVAHTDVKDHECKECSYKTATKGSLTIHIRLKHTDIRDYKCDQCDMAFGTSGKLSNHISESHDGIRDYACSQCTMSFKRSAHLTRHVEKIHSTVHKCEQCNLMFALREYYEHMQTLHPPECKKCNKIFQTLQYLRNHEATHNTIRNFECQNCEYKTTTLISLDKHKKVCTGYERISSGELAVKNALDMMKITYCREKKFLDCRNINPLPFDFYLPQYNAVIEFDGEQHFEPIDRFNGQIGFEKTQCRDAIKNAYCAANNIRLLRIKYTDKKNVKELIAAFLETFTPILDQESKITHVIVPTVDIVVQ